MQKWLSDKQQDISIISLLDRMWRIKKDLSLPSQSSIESEVAISLADSEVDQWSFFKSLITIASLSAATLFLSLSPLRR